MRSEVELLRSEVAWLRSELGKAGRLLGELCKAIPGAVLVCDGTGRIETASEAATAMLGYAEHEFSKLPLASLFESSESLDIGGLVSAPPGAGISRSEKTLLAKGGERVPALLCVGVSGGENVEPEARRIVCVALDLRERKRLELELRQAQKLESMGRLAAGVAHEINTPVQFVSDSIHFLRDATTDILEVVGQLQIVRESVLAGKPSREDAEAASVAEEQADLAYLIENVPKAFDRSVEGLGRVTAIVRSMKEFAHPSSKAQVAADLNHAIQSTLTVARNEYKYVADLDCDFGELPPVVCSLGDLNQAILNMIVNAAHAIGDVVNGTEQKGRITVRTRAEGPDAVIEITDTGGGIPEHIMERIFDPFFTTKEVGKGTGQGLAIAHSVVVERHGGELSVQSEPGSGTTFTIAIPIAGRTTRVAAE